MKKIINTILPMLILAILLFVASCKNPCSDVVCKNNGTCREGACACPSGYEGNFCQAKSHDKLIGYWEGFKRVNGGKDSALTLIVTPGSNPKNVVMYYFNVFGPTIPFTANISNVNVDIPQQIATGGSNFQYVGSGRITDGKYIHIEYFETEANGTLNNCLFEGKLKTTP
jgi:EGF-like domain